MIVLALGRRELGKTTLAAFLARRSTVAIYLDPRGLIPVGAEGAIGDLPDDESELWARLDDPTVTRIVVRPDDLERTNASLSRVVRDLVSADARTIAIVLDEAGLLDLRPWYTLIRCGPRDRLTIILTAHRPQDIPTVVRALADSWCLFRSTQSHDLDAIEDRCGPAVRAEVMHLAPRQFVLWDDAQGSFLIYRDPAVWYVPLGDTAAPVSARLTLPGGVSARGGSLFSDEDA